MISLYQGLMLMIAFAALLVAVITLMVILIKK